MSNSPQGQATKTCEVSSGPQWIPGASFVVPNRVLPSLRGPVLAKALVRQPQEITINHQHPKESLWWFQTPGPQKILSFHSLAQHKAPQAGVLDQRQADLLPGKFPPLAEEFVLAAQAPAAVKPSWLWTSIVETSGNHLRPQFTFKCLCLLPWWHQTEYNIHMLNKHGIEVRRMEEIVETCLDEMLGLEQGCRVVQSWHGSSNNHRAPSLRNGRASSDTYVHPMIPTCWLGICHDSACKGHKVPKFFHK